MGEPFRNVDRALVVLVEFDRYMIKIGRTFGTQVDDDVDDCAARAADELGFGRGRELEMHAAQRSLRDIVGDIGLRDHRLEPVGRKLVLAEAAGEETP